MKYFNVLFTLIAVSVCGALHAAPVSPGEALARVGSSHVRGAKASAPRYIGTDRVRVDKPSMYLFTYSGSDGFMLLPADDRVAPLLAYSETGSFDFENMAPATEWWLGLYADYINSLPADAGAYAADSGEGEALQVPISPLLKTTWDQGQPYNKLCPTWLIGPCPTGCAATAMAQVMNYWQYPRQGTGSISYKNSMLASTHSMNFESATFNWEKMLDTYPDNSYTDYEGAAVAMLMRACGMSIKMQYYLGASGALPEDIAPALKKYFKYDNEASHVARNGQSDSEWEKLVYDELALGRPVIYAGYSPAGGHCFVCDGYDGEGKFHINWGWSGLSDGYYLLGNLTPPALGTGGYEGGFNKNQSIVVGVTPPPGAMEAKALSVGNAVADLSDAMRTVKVKSFHDIPVELKVEVSKGRLSSPVFVNVSEDGGSGAGNPVLTGIVVDTVTASERMERSVRGNLSIPVSDASAAGRSYKLYFYYLSEAGEEVALLDAAVSLEKDFDVFDEDVIGDFIFNADEWEYVGQALYKDAWFPHLSKEEYNVAFYRHRAGESLCLLENPYGPETPLGELATSDEPGYLVFDVSDPECVVFRPFTFSAPVMVTDDSKAISDVYCYNQEGYHHYIDRMDLNAVKEKLAGGDVSRFDGDCIYIKNALLGSEGTLWDKTSAFRWTYSDLPMEGYIRLPGADGYVEGGILQAFDADRNYDVFSMQGILVKRGATPDEIRALPPGLYIVGSRKLLIK